MAKIHTLKTHADFFDAVVSGEKRFEVRKNDRGFEIGDQLRLIRTDETGMPTTPAQEIVKSVGYILDGGKFGILRNYVVIGFDGSITLDNFDDDDIEAEYERRFGVADDPIARVYRLLADGEINDAMDLMARSFDLAPPSHEKKLAALIARGRQAELVL